MPAPTRHSPSPHSSRLYHGRLLLTANASSLSSFFIYADAGSPTIFISTCCILFSSFSILVTDKMRTPQCPIAKSTCSGVNSESPTTSSSFIPTADLNDDILTGLPDDVLFQILLYCGPKEVDETIKLVCRRLQ